MVSFKRWLLVFGLLITSLISLGSIALNKLSSPSHDFMTEEEHHQACSSYKTGLTQLSKKTCKDPLNLAYVTTEMSQQMMPISLESGLIGKPFHLDFNGKLIAFAPDGKSVYLADQDNKRLVRLDLASKEISKLKSPQGVPTQLVLSSKGQRGYALYPDAKKAVHFDLIEDQFQELATFINTPETIAVDPLERYLYIGFKDTSEITSLDLKTGQIKSLLFLDKIPEALTFSHDGQKLYAAQEGAHHITVIDIKTLTTKTLELDKESVCCNSKTTSVRVNFKENHAYITKDKGHEILKVNFETESIETVAQIPEPISSVAFYPEQELIASFTVSEAFEGEPTQFNASTTSSLREGAIFYHWDFGDGLSTVSEEPLIEHAYETFGVYIVELTTIQTVENFETHKDVHLKGFNELISTSIVALGVLPHTARNGHNLENINKAPPITSTTVGTPSQTTIVYGQTITDSAVVTGTVAGGSPTGTVTFSVGSTQIGSPVTLTAGPNNTATATSSTTMPAAVGNYQFTAAYNGDSTYSGSQDASATNAFTVTQATSTTTLVTSTNPSVFGNSVTLTASVAIEAISNNTATGTVTFFDGSTSLGTVTLASGSASLPVTNFTVGTHSLTAVYNGTTNFAGSTSNAVSQTVNQGTTSTGLVSSVNPSVFGNSTLLTATITVVTGAGTPTGIVTFKDGSTIIGTGTLSGNVATLSISTLGVGAHSLTAVYGGDANFVTSTSTPALTQTVNQGTTTSTLTSTVNPTTYGQSTTFTATVAVATGVGTPTGFFTFLNGSTTLGTVNLTGNSASFPFSTLAVGANSITAVYSGDTNFSTSTSNIITQQVNKATPIITLVSSLNPSNYAQNVTFTSTVTAPTTLGLPSGTVTFFDGSTNLGSGTLVGTGANTGTATFALMNLSGGSHSITAVYSGDSDFVTVTSSPALSQSVILANTTTVIYTASSNPTEFGQPVILEANVIGSVAAPPLPPTTTVTFYDGSTPLGTATLTMISPNTGTATLTVSNLSLGSHTLTADYSGDINYNSSNSTAITQKVVPTGTTSVVTSSITPSVYGQTITFTSTVNSSTPGQGSPTGTVKFYNGINFLGTGTLSSSGPNSSIATLMVSSLSLGSHTILTTYGGDGNFTGSTSPNLSQSVIQDNTTTVLSSSENPSNFGDNITISATVTANAPGSGTPTGTVNFYEGSTLLGTGTVNGSGVATYSSIALYPGTNTLHAIYSGDTNYITSTSTNFNQMVINQLPTVTTITSGRNSSPINQAVTYSATVTAITGTPTGSVTFYDNGVLIGTGTITNGVATVTEPSGMLGTLGPHPITAVYSGDANFITSNAPSYPQYVVPYDTSTVLTVAILAIPPNHIEQANATFTATVTATGTPTPIPPFPNSTTTDTVTFYDDGVAVSPPLAVPPSGIVSYTPDNLHFNSRTITAVFSGDTMVFATSTSNPLVLQVQQTDMLTTSSVLTSSLSTSYFCETVTFTTVVHATQGFYTPTGTVTFFDGTTSLGSAILDKTGTASLPVSSLSIGAHTITSSYNSDSNYAFSFSNTLNQTVIANPTTLTFSLIPNTSTTIYGQEIILIAQVSSAYGTPTGVVIFSDADGDLATVDVDSTGTAILYDSTLPVGSYVFTATYDPQCCTDPNSCFVGSSNTLNLTITPVIPKLVLSATPSPGVYGNTITIVGLVSTYQIGTPTGTVSFYNGSTFLGTEPIIDGMATITTAGMLAGVSIVKAVYNGDSNFLASNFPSIVEVINKAPVNVSLLSLSPNPSVFGEVVTLMGTAVSNVTVPTGSMSFFSGSTLLGTATLDTSGVAYLNTTTLAIGNNTISATYSGDSNFLTGTAASYVQTVSKANTQTTITSSTPDPSNFNSPVTFNVTVSPAFPGSGTPTGSITGFYGSVSLGTATLSGGTASFVTTVLPAGTQTITAVYAGDTNFFGSSGLATQTVNAAATTVATLTSSVHPSVFGQPVTFSTTVSSTAGIPQGIATFLDGTTVLGVTTLSSSGSASLTTSSLSVATHSITVKYTATGNFATATSAAFSQVVNKAATTTTLTSTAATSVYGQTITFTGTVSPTSPGAGTPTGTITFKNGATTLGSATISNGGTVTFSTASLPASATPYSLTAVYSGDGNFLTSTSSTLSQTVNPVSTITNATSSLNPSTLGQLVTFNVSVTAVNNGIVIPNGTVTASYGSTIIGTGQLSPAGTISFVTSTLPAGTLPIVFSYAGNTNFNASTATLDQTVNQASTTTALTSSLNPSDVGQPVTFTATVSATAGSPTGTVEFFDGTTLIGTQALVSGVAALTTSSLTLGAHTITAVYSGDTSYSTSTSAVLTQNVHQGVTSTTLTSSVNPSVFGQQTILTATIAVTTGAGNPTGTVTFKDGSTVIGTGAVSGNVATFSTSSLSVGSHTLTAVYGGDTNFVGSTSTAITQVVNVATTSTTLTASPNPVLYGEPVTFTAAVQITLGAGTPTGTVTFKDGSTTIGTGNLVGNQATFTSTLLTVGSHTITAVYNGDGNFHTSTSNAVTEVVNQAPTTTVLTSGTNPSMFGAAIVLTATIMDDGGAALISGSVIFKDGATTIGTGTVSAGIATLSISTLTVGSHSLTADYSGDSNYTSSNSAIFTQVVNEATTSISVVSSFNPSIFGDSVTFTATVVSAVSSDIPDGAVNFYDGNTLIGTALLNGSGVASISVSDLAIGGHSITAAFIGNSDFQGSLSTSFTQTVNLGTTSTTLTSSVNPTTFGQSTTLTATIAVTTGAGSPTGSVTFFDGMTTIGTASISGGTATLAISSLSIGSHSLTAVYNGDNNFDSSTSNTLTQVVNQANSVTNILATTPNPSMFGQTVTFFATTSVPVGFATGTVSFFDGSTLLGTVPTYDGLAIFESALLAIGNHTITAVYNGDSNFLTSTSPPVVQVVNQTSITATTVTAITSNLNPSQFGQNVTFSINVTPITGSQVPTGIVTIYAGATPLATETLVNGMATYSTATLPAGTSNIVALYSGDSNFSSSTGTIAQVVEPIATTSTLTSTVNPSVAFQSVTFSSTITSTFSAVPTGSVSFFDGSTLLGTTTVNNLGVASLTTTTLTAGTHPISAVYNPDPNFQTSTGNLSQVVNLSPTTSTILTSSPNPSVEGNSVSFIASVSSTTGIPTGTASFYDGATLLGTEPIFNGLAIFNTATLTAAGSPHSITVTYNGNANFATSTSVPFTQVVNNPTFVTTTTLVSLENPAELGSSVTLVATVTSTSGTPTGSVAFFDGTSLIGAQIIVAGHATMTTSVLALGSHNITAVYAGDSTYDRSASPVLVQVITQATTTTALTSSVNPSFFGQQTLLTATVTVSTGPGNPTGSVTFKDGSTVLGIGSVNNSVATLVVSSLSVGSHSLTADYSGDTNYVASNSPTLTQVVNIATTATVLTSSPNPSLFGQPVALTATVGVVNGAGVPSGTVTFYDGPTMLGTGTLVGGQATFTATNLSFGSHSLTAVYTGTPSFATSTSSPLTQVVNQASTTTTLTSGTNPSMFGQSVLFTASVSVGSGSVQATGTVTFKDGSTTIGSQTLSGGVASISVSNLSVGSHNLTAVYSGDTNYSTSTSTILSQVVNAVTTNTTVISSVNPSLIGQSVTFTATVTALVGAEVPNGVVNFNDGSILIGTGTLSGGVASISTSSLSVGSHSITVTYIGNSNFMSSTSSVLTQTVNSGNTSAALVSSVNPSTLGEDVTFTATVTVTSGTGTPTGTVTFWDGSTEIGTGSLISGTATFTTSALAVGSHNIMAAYSGDASFNTSVSSPVVQVVNKAASVTNLLSSTPNPSMLGQNVTFFAAVTTPVGSPTGTVTFFDGMTSLGTVPVYDGLAIFATPLLSLGNHSVTAHYNGDSNFVGSTSLPIIQTVNQTTITATTVTTITSNLNPSLFGQAVTFDVVVHPLVGPGTPTGIVSLFSGAEPLVSVTLVNGQASFTTSDLPAGDLTIVALYSGDSAFSSSSAAISQVVLPITTNTQITSSLNPSMYQQAVTFTSTVTSTSGPTPTGSVSFFDGANLLVTLPLNLSGTATYTTSNLTTTTHTITSQYNPDPNYSTSSASLSQVVNPASTVSAILTSSPNPSDFGESVTFFASVSSAGGIPTGTVTFYDGATVIGTEPLFNGLAIFNTSALTPGSHSITVMYGGSTNFAPSTSLPYTQIVQEPLFNTSILLSSSLNPAEFGDPVTFTANVSSTSGNPTGTVTFYDGSLAIGSAMLIGGNAQITTSTLSIGDHPIVAVYSGDANFSTSTSETLIEVITASTFPLAPQDFYGCQVINKYLNTDEVVNVLTWSPPVGNESVVGYAIFRDAALTQFVAFVDNQCPFRYEDGNRRKKVTYTYYIVSLNDLGNPSPAISTKVYPLRKTKKGALEFIDTITDVLNIKDNS